MNLLRNLIRGALHHAAGQDGGEGSGGAGDNRAAGDDGGGDGGSAGAGQRAEIEARARDWGWSPKDQWRGNPDGWLDAPEFVRRGEQVLPILQANYRKTETEVRQLRQQNQQIQQQLTAANESIKVLTDMSTEASRQSAKEKRRELLRAQAQARTDGDAEAEIELGEQIADITAVINREEAATVAPAATTKKPAGRGQPSQNNSGGEGDAGGDEGDNDPTQDPAYQAFVQANPWFGTDRRRTALAVAIGQEFRSDPAYNHLQGKAFFERIVAEVNRTIAPPRSGGSKVEGDGGGRGGNGGSGNGFSDPSTGKSFSDLPPEAKSAFERQAKLVVGEGRAFKTMDEWRKYYVTSYFNS